MRIASIVLASASFSTVAALSSRPVKKVIAILQDMQKQLDVEQHSDEGVYNKVKCWCDTNDKTVSQAVLDAQAKIKQLGSQIEELTGTISRLESEIENLTAEIDEKTASLAEATEIRKKELADFNEAEKDMLQSIGALKSAIQVLSKHNTKSALISVSNIIQRQVLSKNYDRIDRMLTPEQREILHSALVQKEYWDAKPIGEGSYSSASGQIFGILNQMLDTFKQEMSEEQKIEAGKQKAYTELKTSLEQQIGAATDSKESKVNEKAKATESLQIAKDDKADTEATLSADEKFLLNLKETCENTDAQWEERQKTRAEESEAISEAIGILGSDEADNAFVKTFNKGASVAAPATAESAAPVALLQSSSLLSRQRRDKVYALLSNVPESSPNKMQLSALAVSVQLDSFTKVKAAIDAMVGDLKKQQGEEVKERDYCNNSFNKNDKATIEESNNKEQLEAEIEFQKSEIARLADELAAHAQNIKELSTEVKKAGDNREQENNEFQTVIREQSASLQVLRKATAVLARVYQTDEQKADATGGAMLSQIRAHDTPKTPQPEGFNAYKKQAGGGVIGMLEKIAAETEAMKKEAIVAEQTAQKDYEKFIQQSNESVEAEEKSIVNKSEQKSQLENAQGVSENNLEASNSALLMLAKEKSDFHSRCDYLLKNFDARQEARQQEMDALQTAKSILSGANFGGAAQA